MNALHRCRLSSAPRGPSLALHLIVILGMLSALGPLSIDLYVPAFPNLQSELRLNDLAVQATLAVMTGGLAVGQAVVGTWSDRVGRRKPLLLTAALHFVGSIVCAAAPTLAALLAGRIMQGLGAAGSAVLVVAIIRDLTTRDEFLILLVRVNLVITGAPLLAPVAGASLLPLIGWRGLFVALAMLSGLLIILVWRFLPESMKERTRPEGGRLRLVLADRQFRLAALAGAATYAGVYAYVAASPLLLRNVLGFSATSFSLVFLGGSVGLLMGLQIAGRLARRFSPRIVLLTAASLAAASALSLLLTQHFGAVGVVASLWLFVAACGACFPCASTLALAEHAEHAGTASSAYGFTTFASAALVSSLPGLLGVTSATPVAIVLGLTSVSAIVATVLVPRSSQSATARRDVRPEPGA